MVPAHCLRFGLPIRSMLAAVILITLFGSALRGGDRAGLPDAGDDGNALYLAQINAAAGAWRAGDVRQCESLLRRQLPQVGERDWRGFEWYYLWRLLDSGRPLRRIELPDALKAIACSPDGNKLAVVLAADHSVMLLDSNSGEVTARYEQGPATGWRREFVAFSPDGRLLAYQGRRPNRIRVRNLDTGEMSDFDAGGPVYAAVFSSDSKSLVTGDSAGVVLLWNVHSGDSKAVVRRGAPVAAVTLSPDDRLLAVGCLTHSPIGVRLVDNAASRQVTVHDLATGKQKLAVAHDQSVAAIAFSPDGRLLASGGGEGAVKVCEIANGAVEIIAHQGHFESTTHLADERIKTITFSPDGRFLAAATQAVQVWRTSDWKLQATLPVTPVR